MRQLSIIFIMLLSVVFIGGQEQDFKPLVDWGHWRLGQKADLEFLQKNHMTITFGSGAPNFEDLTRAEFDQKIEEAKAFNKQMHDQGYIVLRYLSTALGGRTATNKDEPQKDQIEMLKFYNVGWQEFADIIGPKPPVDPTSWIMVRPDGTFPHYRYAPYGRETGGGFETWGCPDNPYYVQMMEGKIRQQAVTGIDGSYVDWTQIAGGTCYCEYTRKNFIDYLQNNLPPEVAKNKYGVTDYAAIELPQKRGDKFWMEWVTYRGHAVAEFHKKLRAAAREVNPNFIIAGNVFGGFGYGPIAYDAAGNMEMLGRDGYDDFIYSEIQEFLDSAPRKDDNGTKITNGPALKFLAAASHGKPVIIYATEITPPIFPDPTEQCLSAMAQINIAEAVVNHCIFREKRLTPEGATALYKFLAANEPNLLGAQLHSNIAILASLNQYLADELSFAFSTSRVLSDRGIAHIMLVEDDLLGKDLNQQELIVIPYLPLLSIEKQQALQKYVETGGILLVLGQSGIKNEYNVVNKEMPLAKMFSGKGYPESYAVKKIGKGKVAYLPLAIPEHRYLVPAKAKSEFTTFGPSMADVFPDIPEGYTRNRINPELRPKLEEAVDKMLELLDHNATQIITESPYLEMTTMQQSHNDLLLVHLVNYDVTVAGVQTPAEMVDLQICLPAGKKVKKIQYNGTLSGLQPLEYKMKKSNLVAVTVPRVEVYGLMIIELE
jgi:hypothetical protein